MKSVSKNLETEVLLGRVPFPGLPPEHYAMLATARLWELEDRNAPDDLMHDLLTQGFLAFKKWRIASRQQARQAGDAYDKIVWLPSNRLPARFQALPSLGHPMSQRWKRLAKAGHTLDVMARWRLAASSAEDLERVSAGWRAFRAQEATKSGTRKIRELGICPELRYIDDLLDHLRREMIRGRDRNDWAGKESIREAYRIVCEKSVDDEVFVSDFTPEAWAEVSAVWPNGAVLCTAGDPEEDGDARVTFWGDPVIDARMLDVDDDFLASHQYPGLPAGHNPKAGTNVPRWISEDAVAAYTAAHPGQRKRAEDGARWVNEHREELGIPEGSRYMSSDTFGDIRRDLAKQGRLKVTAPPYKYREMHRDRTKSGIYAVAEPGEWAERKARLEIVRRAFELKVFGPDMRLAT